MRRLLAAVLACSALAGCGSPLAEIDRETFELLRRRQAVALGEDRARDPRYALDLQDGLDVSDDAYDEDPATRNPPADRLPARAAAEGELFDDLEAAATQPQTRFDLRQLLGYAIANSPEYKTEKEALFLTALSLIVERHLWGPRFFDSVSGRVTGTPEFGDSEVALSLVNEFGVTQRLPYGGSVSATALVDYVNLLRESADSVGPDEQQSARVGLSVDLPLLRGAGVVARESRIQAERDTIYAARSFERFRRGFLVDLSNTYFDLLRQQRQIENQLRQLENLERLAERFEALARTGREPQFEAERTRAQVLFEQSNLVNAREAYAEALDSLKIRIGMPTTRQLDLTAVDVSVPVPELDRAEGVSTAMRLRLDLQTVSDQVEDAARRARVARNRLLPELDLSGSLTLRTDPDRDVAGLDFEGREGTYSLGADLELPLDRKIEKADYRAALIDLGRARRGYRLAEDRVALAVRRSIRQIERARFNLDLQEQNVRLAERRAVGVELRERTLGPRDIIEAQEDLLDARNRRDEAVADLRQAVLQYLLDTGQMRVDADGTWQPPAGLVPPVEAEPADPEPAVG